MDTEGQHRRRKNEERARARVDRHEQHAEKHHPPDMNKRAGILKRKQSKVEKEKYNCAGNVERPDSKSGVGQNRIDEKESKIDHPEKRTPTVIFILEDGSPRLQLPMADAFVLAPNFTTNWNQRHGSIFAPTVNFGHSAEQAWHRTRQGSLRERERSATSSHHTAPRCRAVPAALTIPSIFSNSHS